MLEIVEKYGNGWSEWTVKEIDGHWRGIATFQDRDDAELFVWLKELMEKVNGRISQTSTRI